MGKEGLMSTEDAVKWAEKEGLSEEQAKALVDKADENADGSISLTEFKEMKEGMLTSEEAVAWVEKELGLPKEKAETIVKNVDQNQDGKISQAELDTMKAIVSEIKNHLLKRFHEYDAEKTGFVTKENAKSILQEELKGMPEKTIDNMINRYDADGNDKFDFGEFIIFYSYARAKKDDVERRFKELDIDESNTLTMDELCTLMQDNFCLDPMTAQCLLRDMGVSNDEGSSMNLEDFKQHWTKLCL